MTKKKLYNSGGIVYSTATDFKLTEPYDEAENLPAGEQEIKIKLDKKRRAGKVVTIINGFSMKEDDIADITKQLKNFCGTGGSAKNFEIIIQGDHIEKILNWFLKKGFSKIKKI